MMENNNTLSLPNLGFTIRHLPSKRIFDILFSLTALVLGTPLYLLVALCVFVSSPGYPIYAHRRVGRGGKSFLCYKFRTMHTDADRRLNDLLEKDPKIKEEWEKNCKLKQDPRVTPIGHFLRKSSLDEIPQFWNVLKGDLSIVGPRPVIQEEINTHYQEKAQKILSVRPGITGLWQVSGRSNTSYEERIQLDEQYINQRSLLLDTKIILKTIPAILFTRGAC